MNLQLKKYQNTYIIELNGELDLYNAHKLEQLYHKMTERNIKSIIIDLKKLSYLNSTGLGTLVYIYKNAKNKNINLLYCNLIGFPKKLIQTAQLDKFFPIENTLNDCLKS